MEPIELVLNLDLDGSLVKFRGYNRDGEEMVAPLTVEELVLDLAAANLAQRAVGAQNEGYKSLTQRVREITEDEIRARVVPFVEEAIAQPFRRTNEYGEARGEPVTLRDEVIRVATDYLTKPPRNTYNRDKGTAVEQFIAGEVKKVIDAELRDALNAAKADVAAAVRDQAAGMIEQTISKLAGVK